jgi:dinuclear metal center YbgI/SA1388 family protein
VSPPRVRELVATLEEAFPSAWAEPWDKVGLLAGDPEAVVAGVFVSLDPTPEALAAAVASRTSVLLTHHPAYLESASVTAVSGLAGVPFTALCAGVALVAAHTNLDRSPGGAEALPLALGLRSVAPLESGGQSAACVVTYAPPGAADAIRAAMTTAGAGRVGAYTGCSFTCDGVGRFVPGAGSLPAVGTAGQAQAQPEVRIEVICRFDAVEDVARAVRAAHPYEEPVIIASETTLSRGGARMGRLCETDTPMTLGALAESVGRSLGVRATVWGDAARKVRTVATVPGSGRSLVRDAVAAGADAFVTGELRYHDALDAVAMGLAVIEAGHDATEWPMVPVLAAAAARTPGLARARLVVDTARTTWWTTEGAANG